MDINTEILLERVGSVFESFVKTEGWDDVAEGQEGRPEVLIASAIVVASAEICDRIDNLIRHLPSTND